MSKFFINRPIFAWVVAIVIMLGGFLAIKALPVTQYPDVAAPAVYISGSYPGASAQTVQDTVVQVIEQQINGLDGFRYISSQSYSTGNFQIIVTFDQGTDPDIAQVQVQNKLALAQPMLPLEVQNQGVSVGKYQVNFMLVIGLYCDNGLYDENDLGNYIVSNLKDPLSRTPGVGELMQMAGQYSMRIWLNPEKLYSYQLMPSDVASAISAQNVQVSSGQLAGLPTVEGTQLTATVIGKNKMTSAEDFQDILVKTNLDGSRIRLRDVAEVELGSENYSFRGKYNNYPAAVLAVRLAPGGNVLEATLAVKSAVAELEPFFPEGIKVVYPYETAPSVDASIKAVIHTLVEAIVLVFLVMYLFLQDFRATLIPTLAVPVVLMGAFAVLFAFGFTINIITMMGLVLAIGLLVDDAIVVVENVERIMDDEGLPPKEATEKSMGQIQGALVGIGLVISAVFFPMAFFGGSTGVIYRQFSVTIIAAMTLSVLIAVVFTPALCATILRRKHEHAAPKRLVLGPFFVWFNRMFRANSGRYARGVEGMLRHRRLFAAVTLAIFAVVIFIFPLLPTAFLPDEDNGKIMVSVQLPPNATLERTERVLQEIRDYYINEEKETVQEIMGIGGYSSAGRGQNVAMFFIKGRDFEERAGPERSMFALAERSWARFSRIADASIIPIVPPPIAELGNATGFDFFLMDRGGLGHDELMAARNQFLTLAAQEPTLTLVRPNGMEDEPQYRIIIDDEKARSLTISLLDIDNTMSIAWGSAYVNDFIDRGRVKKVFVQGDKGSRVSPEDFDRWHVRNAGGQMVPFSAFSQGEWTLGSPKLERYNGVSALEILGQPAGGVSSGDAMATVERLGRQLPPGVAINFTGLSYEERLAGDQTAQLYALSLLIVFLCLAALYESWSIPISVMLVVPMGVLGAVAANLVRGMNNDVFFQVGILTIIGLSAKNAILIVEFAKELHEKGGRTLTQAAIEAAKLRFRPILMTSLAFIFGVLPMAKASGASAASQQALGTTVVGGTFSATCLAVFFVPLFYVLVAGLFHREKKAAEAQAPALEEEPEST